MTGNKWEVPMAFDQIKHI